ncbi:hypothetical protein BC834DRAFT_971563 [Gloeopeniophorella convolvens]|nr:hypothetical protein BC834DRAFT_971563 [Gloeopeniophorella convolvens]
MSPLHPFPLPLPQGGPPTGYGWEDRSVSHSSTISAFDAGIDRRDRFLGENRCVICGKASRGFLQHCHIVPQSEYDTWDDLWACGWIPELAERYVHHEPCNGLLLCANHCAGFVTYRFFIRFVPTTRKFIFINYSGDAEEQQYHGKVIALDNRDRHAPFPALFIIHEMRVRGFHPFRPLAPAVDDDPPWQDWILSDGVADASGALIRGCPKGSNFGSVAPACAADIQLPQVQPPTDSGSADGKTPLVLNQDVIADILAATRAMPSWKACMVEGMSWSGTAEENSQKYTAMFGLQEET